ncbi:tyrosine-type recombinase/integrase [Rhodococcus opacus]|uniref:tyrosine-type recombinase/integrase n=1 Tax=Rhodococcus opacus TaxID=37919 RepID=UPI001F59E724|nr:tyrosine-type recombinase/integrase [Rhodococcus opacus]UNN05027.1 tyrosine-type recombinase/integrase [Rhodococcus opacus]
MTTIRSAIDEYLTLRRALGFKLAKHDRLLNDFADHLDSIGASTITIEVAVEWATRPAAAQPVQWSARLCAVRGFARYLHAVDPAVEVPPADLLPHRHRRPTPYLFTPPDIAALLAATDVIRSPLRATTYHALFGLLAATGIRVGEAIRLDDADLDLGLLTVHDTKVGKSRRLPLHATTIVALDEYRHERDRLAPRPKSESLFVSTAGTRLIYHNVNTTFRTLVTTAGIGAPARPRIHGLRHSFAVATLLRWYRDGGGVQARLPLLSAYLGHSHPSSTYWYLQAAPELLALAAERLDHPREVL